ALLVPLFAVRAFPGRISAWTLWCANLALLCVFALLCSLEFAELNFLFVIPVAAALVGCVLVLRSPAHGRATALPPVAIALPTLGAAFTLLPSLLMTYTALGADAWPIITAICGLIAMALAPLLVDVRSRTHRACLLLAILAVVVGTALTMLQPAYSREM